MERSDSPRWHAAPILLLAAAFVALLGFTTAPAWGNPVSVRWEDRFDAGYDFPVPPPILPNSSAAVGKVYYVAGSFPFRQSPSSNADIHLRAYAIGSGALRWVSVWAPTAWDDQATGLTAAGRVIAVAGRTGLNSTGNNAFVVRAFDAANGATLWQDQCGTANSSGASSITSAGKRVFVAGTCVPATDGNSGLLRAYAARDGALLWEVRDGSIPQALAVAGGALFELAAGASGELLLRAYDTASGAELWETTVGVQGTQILSRLTVGGGAVYAAWETGTGGGTDRGIAAYQTASGAGLWQVSSTGRVSALAWASGRLFAAQSGGSTLLSAYDDGNGALLWQDQPGTGYSAEALMAAGSRIYLAGSHFDSGAEDAANWLVRAYTLQGQLSWEDDQPATNELDAAAANLVGSTGRVIAAGGSGRDTPPFGMMQWWVRGYGANGVRRGRFR